MELKHSPGSWGFLLAKLLSHIFVKIRHHQRSSDKSGLSTGTCNRSRKEGAASAAVCVERMNAAKTCLIPFLVGSASKSVYLPVYNHSFNNRVYCTSEHFLLKCGQASGVGANIHRKNIAVEMLLSTSEGVEIDCHTMQTHRNNLWEPALLNTQWTFCTVYILTLLIWKIIFSASLHISFMIINFQQHLVTGCWGNMAYTI